MRITEEDSDGFTEVSIPDFEILSHDPKLMSLLDKTKKLFEERYQEFIELAKTV
jgi:hypothetical protein